MVTVIGVLLVITCIVSIVGIGVALSYYFYEKKGNVPVIFDTIYKIYKIIVPIIAVLFVVVVVIERLGS